MVRLLAFDPGCRVIEAQSLRQSHFGHLASVGASMPHRVTSWMCNSALHFWHGQRPDAARADRMYRKSYL